MKNSRFRQNMAGLVHAFVAAAFTTLPANAQVVEYDFTALVTAPGVPINGFEGGSIRVSRPTINNSGVVAYRIRSGDFRYDLVLNDGSGTTTINLNTASGFSSINEPRSPFINDAGAVAVGISVPTFGGPTPGSIIRINPDGSVTVLATTHRDSSSGDFASIQSAVSMNNSGQVAAKVLLNSGAIAIVVVDDSGFSIVDMVTPDRFNFVGAAINDAGIVAYKAQEAVANSAGGFVSVFTGDGVSPAQIALPLPVTCGNTGAEPDINNNGLVVGQHPLCLVAGSGGAITDVIVDEATNTFNSSIGRLSLNDLDQVVFIAGGLYFGDDPINDKLIEVGDSLFGEPVGNPIAPFCCGQTVRFAEGGGFNDRGQVVFLAATVSNSNVATSYLLRADPVAPDSIADLAGRAKRNKVGLTWTVMPQAVFYNVYRGDAAGGPHELVVAGHVTSYATFTDPGLISDNTYYYVVTWFDAEGRESPVSNEAEVFPAPVRRR